MKQALGKILTGVTIGLSCAAWYALTTGRLTFGTLLVMLALSSAFLAVLMLDGA
ncbi:MAG TPA: hypothetical protein VFM34_11960 [Moraxellaceae bacterium]|nr:hypothetical protein [Moraxellaceae bacterium]